jgi:AcrR family transcriptional regulator
MGKNPGAEPTQHRKRGRAREVVRRLPGDGIPPASRTADRRAILDAAHRVLLRAGTKGLTRVTVAREARVDAGTVAQHFGSRQRLIEALVDRLYADPLGDFAEATATLPSAAERWPAYLRQVRRMQADREATQAYFDVAALALRDPDLRARLGRHNADVASAFRAVLGAGALAELVLAAVDGIELRRALAGDDYPFDQVLELLDRMVRAEFPG